MLATFRSAKEQLLSASRKSLHQTGSQPGSFDAALIKADTRPLTSPREQELIVANAQARKLENHISASSASSRKATLDFNAKLVARINSHLSKRNHPINRFIDKFGKAFTSSYKGFVDTESNDNRHLVHQIQQLGSEFTLNVFKGVNEFIHAVFECLLALYDPDIDGFLEECEHDLDRLVLTRTVQGQVYFVLLVLSRVINKDKDKDLRFKA